MKYCLCAIVQVLSIVHAVEECPETLAFATEPIYASLANILAYQVRINIVYGTIGAHISP